MIFKRLDAHSKGICVPAISQSIFSVNIQERSKKRQVINERKGKHLATFHQVTKMEWISSSLSFVYMSEFLMRRMCPRLNVKNYRAHCEVSCPQHVHGFQWLNSGHQLGQANTIACRVISSALFFFLSLHEEIKQIHILTNNREENYNQRQRITHRIRRIMEVCLQFTCYTHCIILGVTCALHKHKIP